MYRHHQKPDLLGLVVLLQFLFDSAVHSKIDLSAYSVSLMSFACLSPQTTLNKLLGYLAYAPLGVMGFVAPALFLSSLHLYVKDGLFADAWHLRDLLQLAVGSIRQMIIPSLAFWGLMALAWPVYGFAFFLGAWVLIAYSTALFLSMGPERLPSF